MEFENPRMELEKPQNGVGRPSGYRYNILLMGASVEMK